MRWTLLTGLHARWPGMIFIALSGAGCSGEPDPSKVDAGDEAGVGGDLPSYVIPGVESMAAITINASTGEFFVDSAESGKIYHGLAGADSEVTLELFADLTEAGIARGGHIAVTPDGQRLVMVSGFGDLPKVYVIDVASKSLLRAIDVPSTGGGLLTALQDVTVSPDGARAYATNSFENVILVVDLSTFETTSFVISDEFPHVADANQGFINATGLTITPDGNNLVVAHIIDKHLYRISLAPGSLGQAGLIDTAQYNVSGNGLWLAPDGDILEVAGDELRIYRFSLDGEATTGAFQARYQSDSIQPGLTYAVAHGDRILVLNGNGLSLGGAGGGAPAVGAPEGGGADGGTLPPERVTQCIGRLPGDSCNASIGGSSIGGACADSNGSLACLPSGGPPGGVGGNVGGGTQSNLELPIRVLQLRR